MLFLDMDRSKAVARLNNDKDKRIQAERRWDKYEKDIEPLVKRFRDQGNILEVGLMRYEVRAFNN